MWCGILLLGILLLTSKKLEVGEIGGEGWREEGGKRRWWTWFFLPEGEKREVRKVAVLVLLLLLLFPQASIHAQSFLLSWLWYGGGRRRVGHGGEGRGVGREGHESRIPSSSSSSSSVRPLR